MLRLLSPDETVIASAAIGWRRSLVSVCTLGVLIYLAVHSGVTEIRPPAGGTPLVLAEPKPGPYDWPGYRGPTNQGTAETPFLWSSATPPSPAADWQILLPPTTSAPCLWGRQLFVLEFGTASSSHRLVSYDRDSGRRLWELSLPGEPIAGTEASAVDLSGLTPACDGDHVFVPTLGAGELQLTAVTLAGRRAWTTTVGPYRESEGYGVSPTIHGPLVILAADQSPSGIWRWLSHSYIVGVHRQTGELVWRTSRPDGLSLGVPVVAEVAEREQLLLAGRGALRSYDPQTGEEVWHCHWHADSTQGGVVTDGESVFAAASREDGEVVCVRGDGQGDVTETHLVWRDRRSGPGITSVLIAEPWLIQQHFDGTLLAVDKASGRTAWRTRIPETLSAPPILSGRQLLSLDDRGTLHVLDIDRRGAPLLETAAFQGAGVIDLSPSKGALVLSGPHVLARTSAGLTRLGPGTPSQMVNGPLPTRQAR